MVKKLKAHFELNRVFYHGAKLAITAIALIAAALILEMANQ